MSEDCIIIESDDDEIAHPSPPATVSSSTDPPSLRTSQSVLECFTQNEVPSQSRDFAGVLLQREFARLGIPLPNYGLYNGPNLRQLLDAISAARQELIQNEQPNVTEKTKQNEQNVEAQVASDSGPKEPIPKLKIKITPKRQSRAKETKGSKRYKLNEYSCSKSPTTPKRKTESKKPKVPVNNTPAHYLSQRPFVNDNPARHTTTLYKAPGKQEVRNPKPTRHKEQKAISPGTSRVSNAPENNTPPPAQTISVANGQNSEIAQGPLVALADLIRSVSDTNEQIKNEISVLPQNLMRMRNEKSNASLVDRTAQKNSLIRISNELQAQSENLLNMSKECEMDDETMMLVQRSNVSAQLQNPFRNVHSAQILPPISKNSEKHESAPSLRTAPQQHTEQILFQNATCLQQERVQHVQYQHIVQHTIHRQCERNTREKGIHTVECHPRPISAHGGASVHMQQKLTEKPQSSAQPSPKKQPKIQQSKLQLINQPRQKPNEQTHSVSQPQEREFPQGRQQMKQQVQQPNPQHQQSPQLASLHAQLPLVQQPNPQLASLHAQLPLVQQPNPQLAQQVEMQTAQADRRPLLLQRPSPQLGQQLSEQLQQAQEQSPHEQPTTLSHQRLQTIVNPIQQLIHISNSQESPQTYQQAGPSLANQPQYPLQQECIQLPDGRILLSQYITSNIIPEQENNQALVPVRPMRLQPVFPLLFYPRHIDRLEEFHALQNTQEIGFLYLNRLNRHERYLPITEPVSPVEEKKRVQNFSGRESFPPIPTPTRNENAQPIGVIQGNRSYNDSYRNWVTNNTRNSQPFDHRNRRAPELRHIQFISRMRHPPRANHEFYQPRNIPLQMRPFIPVGNFQFRPPQPIQGSRFQQRQFPNVHFDQNFGYQENPDHCYYPQQNRRNRGPY